MYAAKTTRTDVASGDVCFGERTTESVCAGECTETDRTGSTTEQKRGCVAYDVKEGGCSTFSTWAPGVEEGDGGAGRHRSADT
jgi:hypothetical protein